MLHFAGSSNPNQEGVMAIKRWFFDEHTEGCMYHPRTGCVHPSDEASGKFISSLSSRGPDLHAPALDIDFSTSVEPQLGAKSRVVIKGPRPTYANFRRLLEVLVSTKLMDPDDAQPLHGKAAGSRRRDLPALVLTVGARVNPSSSVGHHHLYLDREMPWPAYEQLLLALRDAEIIGQDFCDMSIRWRVSFLLKPGLTKSDLKLRFAASA
ncbi:hypothetical protein IT087_00225 [Candidatus Uhrbacteria bacterium]|nr:hypothetical protein [Candidatus Uhrbacteria bacterium]